MMDKMSKIPPGMASLGVPLGSRQCPAEGVHSLKASGFSRIPKTQA